MTQRRQEERRLWSNVSEDHLTPRRKGAKKKRDSEEMSAKIISRKAPKAPHEGKSLQEEAWLWREVSDDRLT